MLKLPFVNPSCFHAHYVLRRKLYTTGTNRVFSNLCFLDNQNLYFVTRLKKSYDSLNENPKQDLKFGKLELEEK